MICFPDAVRLAQQEDIPRVRAILTDPGVSCSFPELTIAGEPWDGAFEHLAWFLFPGGVFACEVRGDFSVMAHIAVLPRARGRVAICAARSLIDRFFQDSPCPRISGYTPNDLAPARMWNRMLGFRPVRTIRNKTLYALTREEWERGKACQPQT